MAEDAYALTYVDTPSGPGVDSDASWSVHFRVVNQHPLLWQKQNEGACLIWWKRLDRHDKKALDAPVIVEEASMETSDG